MTGPVAIVGAGLIGQSWAVAFARAGHPVALHDRDPAQTARALEGLSGTIADLAAQDLLGGHDARDVLARIRGANELDEALDGVVHVQENAPEDVATKRAVFAALDAAAPPEAVIASSSSALLPSAFTGDLAGAARCLVAHPLNPPHLVPAVEIVPGPRTAPDTLARTRALMDGIGQSPIETTREIEGFVMNRLQGALLDEAFALVDQGVASPADIDAATRDGLARRWAVVGPFETIDLNAPGGVADYLDRYGPAYAEIGRHRPNRPAWSGVLRDRIVATGRSADDRAARARWRDGRLAALARLFSTPQEDAS
ncbi:MAG: 3-hydroxyacyl-CoA dehydrogenase [Pseudomonadota bacterium]